jgi:hypothetical protein
MTTCAELLKPRLFRTEAFYLHRDLIGIQLFVKKSSCIRLIPIRLMSRFWPERGQGHYRQMIVFGISTGPLSFNKLLATWFDTDSPLYHNPAG